MEARSNDLRERVVAGWGRGEGTKAPLARRFAIGQDSVRRIIKRWEATDSVAAKRRGGDRRRKIVGDDHAALKQMPAEEPDATRERFQPRCHDELNIECSLMTLSREFKKMGLTFKKTLKAKEQHREDVQERRETFKSDIASIDPERFVFLDECGGMTNMTRMYGRSLKGARLVDHPPHGHWQNTRVIAAMRLDGGVASMALDGATNRPAFETYVKQLLVPNLRHNDIVVMDNLAAHHSNEAIEAIKAAGATPWFQPPYSPDFNPIEQMGSKVKQCLRRIAARAFERLMSAIGQALASVTAGDCHDFFTGCGYMQKDR
jgi:transposase